MGDKLKIMIVDDHYLVRVGLTHKCLLYEKARQEGLCHCMSQRGVSPCIFEFANISAGGRFIFPANQPACGL